MSDSVRRFAAIYDLHWGYESKGGHKKALHDERAWDTTLKFLSDFKPHDIILGGDILDCGVISHHNHGKPRKTEGFRLLAHATECAEKVIKPLESVQCGADDGRREYIIGNHEDWIEDLLDADPGLEGLVDLKKLLHLQRWHVTDQGGGVQYHKLYFIHGDTVFGGEHVAKAGVLHYERNLRFGHHHTYQVYTKTSPIDHEVAKTGVALPCLCSKDVGYMECKPNKWVQGFLYGYTTPKGPFGETVAIIINGQLVTNGRIYKS